VPLTPTTERTAPPNPFPVTCMPHSQFPFPKVNVTKWKYGFHLSQSWKAPTHRKVQMPPAQVVNNTAILIFELFIYLRPPLNLAAASSQKEVA
jgi:hypothetical protein